MPTHRGMDTCIPSITIATLPLTRDNQQMNNKRRTASLRRAAKNVLFLAAAVATTTTILLTHPVSSFNLPSSSSSYSSSSSCSIKYHFHPRRRNNNKQWFSGATILQSSGSDAVLNGGAPPSMPRNSARYFPGDGGGFGSGGFDDGRGGGFDMDQGGGFPYEQRDPYFDPRGMRGGMNGGGGRFNDGPFNNNGPPNGGPFNNGPFSNGRMPPPPMGDGPMGGGPMGGGPMRGGPMGGGPMGGGPMGGGGGMNSFGPSASFGPGASFGPSASFGGGGGGFGMDPESQKYFSGRGMASRNGRGMYGDRSMGMNGGMDDGIRMGGGAAPPEDFYRNNNNAGGRRGGPSTSFNQNSPRGMGQPSSQRYYGANGGGGNTNNNGMRNGPGMGGPFAQARGQRNGNNNNNNNQMNNNVYDAEIYRDEEYYDHIERLFPVLHRLQGVHWQGHIQYLAGDLQFQPNSAGRRQAGIRYDCETDGSVFLTITLGGRRIEMRGQRGDLNSAYANGNGSGGGRRGGGGNRGYDGVYGPSGGDDADYAARQRGRQQQQQQRSGQQGGPMPQGGPSSFANRGSIRLDPMNEDDPNFMIITELPPDTILINEVDRHTGKVVLTASLSLANDNEVVQVSHDMGDLEMPIEGHQVWSLKRPGTAGQNRQRRLGLPPARGGGGGSDRHGNGSAAANQRRNPTTGIPQQVVSSQQSMNNNNRGGRSGQGGMGRLYPVLSKFAGITWEGDCRQVNGDLQMTNDALRSLFGGSRYDIYDDGTVSLTTFMRSPDGRLNSIVMRGRRVDGPGSPLRLDMERGPNSMIITELAPHTLLMNEVNRETGRVLFTASLFLASDNEVVQVSHQISGRDARMPVDLHQVWRLNPAREGYEEEEEWREREEYEVPQRDRSRDMRGGRSAWSSRRDRDEYDRDDRYGRGSANANGAPTNTGRRSINGLLTEPPPPPPPRSGRNSRYDEVNPSYDDHLWLLNRSPEETRARFREKYDQWGASNRDNLDLDLDLDLDPRDDSFGGVSDLELRDDRDILESQVREKFPVLSQISGINWKGNCRYIIGDTKPDSIMLLKGGIRYDISPSGVVTMTTTLEFDGGRTREVRMRGYKEAKSYSMRLYPTDDQESVYTILTEISPDTILLNEVDSETDKVIYTASLSLSNDGNELVQVTHELGDGVRMPVEGHQVWRMKRDGGVYDKMPSKGKPSWVPGSSSVLEELFPVLSKVEGTGWQGTFRFINGDLERQTNFEATGKMWYDLNKNGTCVLTIVSSLTDGSSRYVQMRGDRGIGTNNPMRLDPVDAEGTNYMIVTELPPDTVLLSEIDRFTGKLVSTASLSVYKDEIIQISHEMGNRTKLDGHQIARLRRSKDRSSTSRGTMSYLLNGELDDDSYDYGGDSLTELFPVLNQIDGLNWQGTCRVVDGNMREQKAKAMLSGGMRYDLHRNGTCTMTSVLMHPDGRTHQIKLQGTRVGKSNKRSIRLDPIAGESPFYTVLTEVPPDTILLNEVDKATNKVIFTASVSIADHDELIQISKDVDGDGQSEDGHKVWRLKRSAVLGRNIPRDAASYRGRAQAQAAGPARARGQGFRPRTAEEWNRNRSPLDPSSSGFDPSSVRPSQSFGTSVPFGARKPKDPNVMFDFE